MRELAAINFADDRLPRMIDPSHLAPSQSWFDDLWSEISRLAEVVGLGGISEWIQTLDWRMAVLVGVAAVILPLLVAGRVMLRHDEHRAVSSVRPRPALPGREDATNQDWVPDIAGRLGLKVEDRQELVDGIERLRGEMQQMFDQFQAQRGVRPSAPSAPLWRRLIERSGDDDTRSITQSFPTLERTYHVLAVVMAAQFLETHAQDDRIAALDGYSGTTLKDALEWWRGAIMSDLASDGRSAPPWMDEATRRMAQVILRSEIIAKTYLTDEANYLHLAAALSSIAGAARQMLARASWSFDRPQLLVWQTPTSSNGIQRSFAARPERSASARGAVTPEKSFYLQFLRRCARDLDSARSVAVDIVEIGYRAPDGRWEPSRLVAFSPAEWM